ncbi:MAG: RNA-binding protein [Legionellales bacterium RIFCSPHIGHO2_12_FULL_35_11]|nr:MAG: RNA-binding protein [Legionellales bacterium RIFCSPHIGHO2_12_FULL_35_11]
MQIKIIFIFISLVISLSSCTGFDYSRIRVQQGNLLSQSSIDRLHLGMIKEDAAILMGTSLMSPLFNNDRWDYAFTYQKMGKIRKTKNLVLYFKNNRLVKIEQYPARAGL